MKTIHLITDSYVFAQEAGRKAHICYPDKLGWYSHRHAICGRWMTRAEKIAEQQIDRAILCEKCYRSARVSRDIQEHEADSAIGGNVPAARVSQEQSTTPAASKVQLWGYRCNRCQHEWLPRKQDAMPRVCPKCKSPYWNNPRKIREE